MLNQKESTTSYLNVTSGDPTSLAGRWLNMVEPFIPADDPSSLVSAVSLRGPDIIRKLKDLSLMPMAHGQRRATQWVRACSEHGIGWDKGPATANQHHHTSGWPTGSLCVLSGLSNQQPSSILNQSMLTCLQEV